MSTITLDRPTIAPDRSLDQRMRALALANETRSARARLKRELRAGRVRFADLLVDPPECLVSAKVFAVLLSVPHVGRVKANRVFVRAGMSPSKTFGGLTVRQRDELLRLLGSRVSEETRG